MRGPGSSVLAAVLFAVLSAAGGCRAVRSDAPGAPKASVRLLPGLAHRIADPERERRLERAALALQPVDSWSGRWMLRQRVRIEWPGGSETFDAVLQRRPGELGLFGLGPMNLVGFRLALVVVESASGRVEGIEVENRSGRELPFSAAHVLADVQRVFYPWIETGDDADGNHGDGERTGRWGAIEIWERDASGRLAERRFTIADAPDAGEVRIRYANWQADPAFPRSVELENGWFGYRLQIETLESLGSSEIPGD